MAFLCFCTCQFVLVCVFCSCSHIPPHTSWLLSSLLLAAQACFSCTRIHAPPSSWSATLDSEAMLEAWSGPSYLRSSCYHSCSSAKLLRCSWQLLLGLGWPSSLLGGTAGLGRCFECPWIFLFQGSCCEGRHAGRSKRGSAITERMWPVCRVSITQTLLSDSARFSLRTFIERMWEGFLC